MDMGSYTTYRERLKAKKLYGSYDDYDEKWNGGNPGDVVNILQRKMVLLLTKPLYDPDHGLVQWIDLKIDADGKKLEHSFHCSDSDGTLPSELQHMLRSLRDADELDIDLQYMIRDTAEEGPYALGPAELIELLENCHEDIFDYIDYVMFYEEDSGFDAGSLHIFGKRSGEVVRGKMEYLPVKAVPESADWYEPQIRVLIENPEWSVSDDNIPRVLEICRNLLAMGDGDEPEINENFLYFLLAQPEVNSRETLELFVNYLSELATLIDIPEGEPRDSIFLAPNFNDVSDDGPNLLEILVKFNGEVEFLAVLAYEES